MTPEHGGGVKMRVIGQIVAVMTAIIMIACLLRAMPMLLTPWWPIGLLIAVVSIAIFFVAVDVYLAMVGR